MADLSPEAAKLLAARKAAADELRAIDNQERSLSDHYVQRLASCRMLADGLALRLLNGEAVPPADLERANSMIDEARKAAAFAALKGITIEYIEGPIERCPECGWHRDKVVVPKDIEGEVIKEIPAAKPDSENNAPKATAKPLLPYHEVMEKDTRPVPARSVNGAGGVAWVGTARSGL